MFSFTTAEAAMRRHPPWLSPPWMAALWPNFVTTLHTSLGWLAGRYRLAALLGAVGGPLSYYAGARLGALTFPSDPTFSLIVLAAVWSVAMLVLLKFAKQ
jgi:hypothetical protein